MTDGENKTADIGNLLFFDSAPITTEQTLAELTKDNMNHIFRQLFNVQKQQPKPEIMEFERPVYTLDFPEGTTLIPRFRPLPKEKPKTKWEKFREEKGMAPRAKRSRLVFDPITKEFVPRWGHGSKKKIEEKHQWMIEEQTTDIPIEKQDLFTQRKNAKEIHKGKQEIREMRNKMRQAAVNPNDVMKSKQQQSAKKGPAERKDKSMLQNQMERT